MNIKLKPITCVSCQFPITPLQGNYCSPNGDYCIKGARDIATPFQLGTIISDTLRTEDLLAAFVSALERLDIANQHEILIMNARDTLHGYNDQGMLAQLEDALDDLCPPFVYFGARRCKSCCTDEPCSEANMDFGFWPDMDALWKAIERSTKSMTPSEYALAQQLALGATSTVLDDEGVITHVLDIDHVTVMDLDRNVLWSIV